MKRFDMFIVVGNEINYKNTYYHNETNDTIEVKNEKVVLLEGERMLLKMLNNKVDD